MERGEAGVSQESNGKEAVGQNAKRARDMPVDATLARTYQSKSGSCQRCHVGNDSGDRGSRTKSCVKDLYLLCTVKCEAWFCLLHCITLKSLKAFFSHVSDFSEGNEERLAAGLDWFEPFKAAN